MSHRTLWMTSLFMDIQPWLIAHGKMNGIFGTILHFLAMEVASISAHLWGPHFAYWNCANEVFSCLWYDNVPLFSLLSLLFVETYIKIFLLSVFLELHSINCSDVKKYGCGDTIFSLKSKVHISFKGLIKNDE